LAVLLFSCSSTLDKKFNKDTAQEDLKSIKSELDSTYLNLLVSSIIRLKFQDKKLKEMTYAEILEDGKKWKAEQKVLTEKAAEPLFYYISFETIHE